MSITNAAHASQVYADYKTRREIVRPVDTKEWERVKDRTKLTGAPELLLAIGAVLAGGAAIQMFYDTPIVGDMDFLRH